MFDVLGAVNFVAVGLAAFASFLLGAVWFAVIFAKPYHAALGRPYVPNQKPALIFLVGPFVCGLVTAIASAVMLRALKVETLGDGLAFGAVVGAGYLASTSVNTAINPNIPRPLFYGVISGTYFFLSSVVIALILVAMRQRLAP